MAKTLFISDLHLDKSRPEHIRALDNFLNNEAQDADALYVLGDLFETWIGDDDHSRFNQHVIALFRHWSDQHGQQLYFIHGNRDFLLGDEFADACGGTLLPEQIVIDLYGRPTLIMHGDSLCTDDEEFMAFREKSRSEQWQQKMLRLPLLARRFIALMMRSKSKKSNSNKADNILDVSPAEVIKQMQQNGVADLIHGHTHRPAVHDIALESGTGKRWVLGDWHSHLWFIKSDAQQNQLVKEPI